MSLMSFNENKIFESTVSRTGINTCSTDIISEIKDGDYVRDITSSTSEILELRSNSENQTVQSSSRILVIGYYNKDNLGDDAYQGIMGQFFPKNKLEFIGSDMLSTVKSEDYDGVIVGGGDIINNYFNNSISPFLRNFKGTKIAFSIGIPFPSLINEKYLGHFNHVFTRNYEDVREIQKVLGSHRAHFIPDIALSYKPTNPHKSIIADISTYLSSLDSDMNRNIGKTSSEIIVRGGREDGMSSISHRNKKCGLFLVGNLIDNPKIVSDIGRLVSKLALTYNITLYCFHPKEDVKISEKVRDLAYGRLNESVTEDPRLKILQEMARNKNRIVVDSKSYTSQEMIDIMTNIDFAICMRYHAHIFCTVAGTPFMSISSTRKTRSFMKQAGLSDYQYEIELNGYGTPIGSNYDIMRTICGKAIHDRMYISEQIRSFLKQSRFLLQSLQASQLLNINITDIRKGVVDFIEETGDHQNGARLLSSYIIGYPDSPYIWGMYQKFKSAAYLSSHSRLSHPSSDELDDNSPDNSGLIIQGSLKEAETVSQITDFEYYNNHLLDIVHESVQYLTRHGATLKNEFFDFFSKGQTKNKDNNLITNESLPLFVDLREYQTYRGAHRGGWYVACEESYKLNSKNEMNEPNGIICDMYIDRTFHWAKSYMKYRGIIPYTSPWCGFIHHTPNKSYSQYNTEALFEIPEFIQSLHTCTSLFSLSEPLSKYLRHKLSDISPHIKVITFAHPVVDPLQSFSLRGYTHNPEKKLINIGSWMRNPFTLYQLNINPNIEKTVIIGKEMNDHLPPKNFEIKYVSKETRESSEIHFNQRLSDWTNKQLLPCRSEITSIPQWILNLIEWLEQQGVVIDHYKSSDKYTTDPVDNPYQTNILYIKEFAHFYIDGNIRRFANESRTINIEELNEKVTGMIGSVKQIEYQSNEDYDKLLTENIVFLDLIDAAAVNTIIECIVRRTPIIVNKIPGTIALLGEEYPLYYENIAHIPELLEEDRISNAHEYLKKLDIKRFRMNYFLNHLANVVQTLDLPN